jgi:hypothetical protein
MLALAHCAGASVPHVTALQSAAIASVGHAENGPDCQPADRAARAAVP